MRASDLRIVLSRPSALSAAVRLSTMHRSLTTCLLTVYYYSPFPVLLVLIYYLQAWSPVTCDLVFVKLTLTPKIFAWT